MRLWSSAAAFSAVAGLLVSGCTVGVPGSLDSGTIGITGGGTQDFAQARSQINSGGLPEADAITVEGFLSEHDIPLAPPAGAPEIYASVALAYRTPFNMTAPVADVFVRLGTTIDVSAYQRPALNLVVVVDRSGSMDSSASRSDYRSKLDAVKQALHGLVERLNENDRLTLISFNERVRIDLPATPVSDRPRVHGLIDQLRPLGNTDLFLALRTGYERAAAAGDAAHSSRVILFTDAQPTVGPDSSPEFLNLQRTYAAQGVGFTLMGVGMDYGTELANDIARVRGGNSFYLADSDRVASIFNDEFDYLVTPAAYDLALEIRIPDEIGIRDVYGVPDYIPGTNGARIEIPTLFFSPREGGGLIVVRLTSAEQPDFEQALTIASATLEYTFADGTARSMAVDLTLPAGTDPVGDPPYYSEDSVKRAAVLLDTALVIREATKLARQGLTDDAVMLIQRFLDYFDEAILGMSDRTSPTSRGLSEERDLVSRLLGTIQNYYSYYPGY